MRTAFQILIVFLIILLVGPAYVFFTQKAEFDGEWWQAPHRPTGLAPDPAEVTEAVIQVYAARSFSWRRAFGVHTWIAIKPKDSPFFLRMEVIGWRKFEGKSPLAVHQGRGPDAEWFGADPWLLKDIRGKKAEEILKKMRKAVEQYPFKKEYHVLPGPNSNTFTAFIGRAVPELKLDLPPTAIGKDYMGIKKFKDVTPSGSGTQISLFGLLGVLWSDIEGIEINLLGLSFGYDWEDDKIRYPGIGFFPPKDHLYGDDSFVPVKSARTNAETEQDMAESGTPKSE